MQTKQVNLPQMAHLQSFLTVVECGSVGEAALVLGLHRSAVSRHLTALEEWFGKKMILSNKNMKLDEDAEKFIDVIRTIFKTLDDSRHRTPHDKLIHDLDQLYITQDVVKENGMRNIIKAVSRFADIDDGNYLAKWANSRNS